MPQLLFLGALLSFAALLSCGGRSQAEFSATLPVGQVTATNNPQVALYTMTLPFPATTD
jgi:hypothetical protein